MTDKIPFKDPLENQQCQRCAKMKIKCKCAPGSGGSDEAPVEKGLASLANSLSHDMVRNAIVDAFKRLLLFKPLSMQDKRAKLDPEMQKKFDILAALWRKLHDKLDPHSAATLTKLLQGWFAHDKSLWHIVQQLSDKSAGSKDKLTFDDFFATLKPLTLEDIKELGRAAGLEMGVIEKMGVQKDAEYLRTTIGVR